MKAYYIFMFINMINIMMNIIDVYEKRTDLKHLHIVTLQIRITCCNIFKYNILLP